MRTHTQNQSPVWCLWRYDTSHHIYFYVFFCMAGARKLSTTLSGLPCSWLSRLGSSNQIHSSKIWAVEIEVCSFGSLCWPAWQGDQWAFLQVLRCPAVISFMGIKTQWLCRILNLRSQLQQKILEVGSCRGGLLTPRHPTMEAQAVLLAGQGSCVAQDHSWQLSFSPLLQHF